MLGVVLGVVLGVHLLSLCWRREAALTRILCFHGNDLNQPFSTHVLRGFLKTCHT